MLIYDSTNQVMMSAKNLAVLAKREIDGDATGATKEDWEFAIQERADEAYEGQGLNKAARFSKAIGGQAYVERGTVYNGGDELAKLCYEASKHAPRAPASTPVAAPAADTPDSVAKRNGPANQRMLDLARKTKQPGESDASAYVRVWTDPGNSQLKIEAQQENWSLANVGDTAYGEHMYAPYSNPNPPPGPMAGSGSPARAGVPRAGSGPRP